MTATPEITDDIREYYEQTTSSSEAAPPAVARPDGGRIGFQ